MSLDGAGGVGEGLVRAGDAIAAETRRDAPRVSCQKACAKKVVDMRGDRDQRAAITEAALVRFARDGFAGTSTRDISDDLGLSRSAIYHHFASKEDILYEIMLIGVQRMISGLDELMISLSDESADVRLAAAIRFTTASNIANLDYRRVYDSEVRSLTVEHQESFRPMKIRYEQYFRDIVAEGVETKLWPPTNIRLFVANVLALCRCHWYDPSGPNTPEEIADFNAEFVLQAIGFDRSLTNIRELRRSAVSGRAT